MITPNFKPILLVIICTFFAGIVNAQTRFTITGTVTGEKDEPVKSAIVFLSGTKCSTVSDEKGHFKFEDLQAGSYKVLAKLPNYAVAAKYLMLQKNTDLTFKISVKTPPPPKDPLEDKVDRVIKLDKFKQNFLGTSDNGLSCKITNPEVLNLKENEKTFALEVTTNDFMIIENRELGYKIKYLLHALSYDGYYKSIRFDGDAYFEEMEGNDRLKQKWKENRLQTYKGSLMHFFRSIFNGPDEPVKQGFLTQGLASESVVSALSLTTQSKRTSTYIIPRPIAFDSLVSVVDDAFIALKFKRSLAITYDPEKAAESNKLTSLKPEKKILATNSSALQLGKGDAIIDSRGSVANAFPFLMDGYWSGMRIGDQLPLEYQP